MKSPPKAELWAKLSRENQEYSQYLERIGDRITILTQTEQEGFGHAVFCARDWVGEEPFLLLLGDHLYVSDTVGRFTRVWTRNIRIYSGDAVIIDQFSAVCVLE